LRAELPAMFTRGSRQGGRAREVVSASGWNDRYQACSLNAVIPALAGINAERAETDVAGSVFNLLINSNATIKQKSPGFRNRGFFPIRPKRPSCFYFR
jgi:hypothetical protein